MTTLNQLVRETSDRIWNQSGKHTHNELDEIISTAISESYSLGKKEGVEGIEKKLDDMRSFPAEMFQLYKGKMPFVVMEGKADENEKFQIFRLGFIDAVNQIKSSLLKESDSSKE